MNECWERSTGKLLGAVSGCQLHPQQEPRRRDAFPRVCQRPDKTAFVARGGRCLLHRPNECCPVSPDHHQWGIVGLRSLVASCMAACMFVWWRKRVCSTVMFTIYVMHAIRAFFRLPPSAALVELDDSVSYIDSGVITNWYRLMQLCCMASADGENAPALTFGTRPRFSASGYSGRFCLGRSVDSTGECARNCAAAHHTRFGHRCPRR